MDTKDFLNYFEKNKRASKQQVIKDLNISESKFRSLKRKAKNEGANLVYSPAIKEYKYFSDEDLKSLAKDKEGNKQNKLEDEILKEIRHKDLGEEEAKALIDQIKNPVPQYNQFEHKWGENHTKIGLISDTHIGSKYANQDMLEDVMERFKQAGVDAVYHAGDITEGYARRKGHAFEIELHGADDQVDGVVNRMPDIGKPIYFILGDHDNWHMDNGGIDIGKQIDDKRSDMHYMGLFGGKVWLNDQTDLLMVHPSKGTSYALSYQPQKFIESLSGGNKPSILAMGHYHKLEYMFYRNVHSFQTGTLQDQTPFMQRMNAPAHTGAWELDVYTKDDGTIDKLEQTLYAYY